MNLSLVRVSLLSTACLCITAVTTHAAVTPPAGATTVAHWNFDNAGTNFTDSGDNTTAWETVPNSGSGSASAASIVPKFDGSQPVVPNDDNIKMDLTNAKALQFSNGGGTANENSPVSLQLDLPTGSTAGFLSSSVFSGSNSYFNGSVTLRSGTTDLLKFFVTYKSSNTPGQNYFQSSEGKTELGTDGTNSNVFDSDANGTFNLSWDNGVVDFAFDGSSFDANLTDVGFINNSTLTPDNVLVAYTAGTSASRLSEFGHLYASTAVPEPSTLALCGAGVLLLVGRRKRRTA